MGRESTVGTEEQRRQALMAKARGDFEVEVCKDGKTSSNGQFTPTRSAAAICRVATVESPDSQDDYVEIIFQKEYYCDDYDSSSSKYEYRFASSSIDNRQRGLSSPGTRCDSVADGSVYLDSYNGDADHQSIAGTNAQTVSPDLKVAKKVKVASRRENLNSLSMSYSMDNDKESFSSYARPSYSHVTSRIMDDTITCPDTNNPNPFSFLKDNDETTRRSGKSMISVVSLSSSCSSQSDNSLEHTPATQSKEVSMPLQTELSEETRKTRASSHSARRRLEDSSMNVASRESFSPLERRNVTFSSALLDETASEESPKPLNRNGISSFLQRDICTSKKPKMTIITKRSLRNLDEEQHETDARSDQTPDIEKGITPHTEATSGTWESDSMSHPSEEDVEASFSSIGGSLPSDEADMDCSRQEENDYSPSKVHMCKSASCTACRYPTQNSPVFISVSTSVAEQQLQLQRRLPNRWWDTQESNYGQLKRYVSSVLQSTSSTMESIYDSALKCVEEHPFDES
jgi:hypothetical protein